MDNIDSKDVRLFCYLLLNNEELRDILSVDFNKNAAQNVSPTFYTGDSLEDIVFKLLVNKNFNEATTEDKKKLIFSDYYPEESKILTNVYLDDRRNLCQEFHNRICEDLNIPRTSVRFLDFTEDMGEDREYLYDPYNNVIYINTVEDFSEKSDTHLLEMVARGTYHHKLQIMISSLVKCGKDLSNAERYVCYSTLLKQTALTELSKAAYYADREALETADEFCSADVYAIYSSFNYLEKLFDGMGILENPEILDFEESRMSFMASLIDFEQKDMEEIEEFEYDEEDGSVSASGSFATNILDDTLSYDFSLLCEVRDSELNKNTNNDLFSIFIKKLEQTAPDFYGYMGSSLGDDYIENFNLFDEEDQDAEEETEEME